MSYEDNQVRVVIRHILTSCWADISTINIRVNKGNVYLSGLLQRMTHEHRQFNTTQLKRLDLSIRSLRTVKAVYYNFDNWECSVYGVWREQTSRTVELELPQDNQPSSPPKTGE